MEEVVDTLASGKELPPRYKNHQLGGKYKGYYDCHIQSDWILVYKMEKERLVLLLLDTETHSDLFR